MAEVDLIIRNGRVIDPANGIDVVQDIAVKDGKIVELGKNLKTPTKSEFDATGCLVTAGLIDAHVHCYQYATPLGINPDETCLSRGVTTIVDAGSAGASTFMGLRKFIIERSKTRVLCLLHIAQHGLAASGMAAAAPGGESDTLAILDETSCEKCINENRDVIVGVKVRLSASVCDNGNLEEEAYRRALNVAQRCGVPVMAHHALSTVPTQKTKETATKLGCPADLRPGDIYTHTFHGHGDSIVDPATYNIHSDVIDAKSRGVLFDLGHGAGGFNWTAAEVGAKNGFWPDLLGTDLHTVNQDGPVYDLPTIMTKFLFLGMPLGDVIKSVTSAPAKAFNMNDFIGSLACGREADITVIKIVDCDVMMEDTQGQTRNITRRVVPVAVWRAGESHPIQLPKCWPSLDSKARMLKSWDAGVVKDKVKPTL